LNPALLTTNLDREKVAKAGLAFVYYPKN